MPFSGFFPTSWHCCEWFGQSPILLGGFPGAGLFEDWLSSEYQQSLDRQGGSTVKPVDSCSRGRS